MGSLAHQLGFKAETTWGVPNTPVDRFLEFVSEGLERKQNIGGSEGIRPGTRYGRGSTRRITRHWAEGPIDFEVPVSGFGLFLYHTLGAVATTNPEAGVFMHTITPGTLLGKGLTLQKGVEKADTTVQAFTFEGAKIKSTEFKNDRDQVLRCVLDFDAQQETTATALASASYTAPRVFHYGQGVLKFAGTTVALVRSLGSLKITNNLDTERFFLGNQGQKAEQINRPRDTIAGNAEIEFGDLTTFHNRFAGDTSFELILEYTDDLLIGATQFPFLRITLGDTRLEGETPKISGADAFPVRANIPFSSWDPNSGNAVKIEYQSVDATP